MCFCTHRINTTVRSASVRHLLQPVVNLLVADVDRLCTTVCARHLETFRHTIDCDHAACTHKPRALDRELADWTCAPHCNGIARLDVGILSGHPTRCED